MRTSTTSSDRAGTAPRNAALVPAEAARPEIGRLVGATPLIRLERSGEGRVLLKHEGYGPGGSFFDRVVRHQLERVAAGREIVVDGCDAYSLSVAVQAVSGGHPVTVVSDDQSGRRLARLHALFGVRRVEVEGGEPTAAKVAERCREGAIELSRRDAAALRRALAEVAAEVTRAGRNPDIWVLADYGIAPDELQAILAGGTGAEPYLELVSDDRERRRQLTGPEAARRAQTGQREGILLSPLGAELVEAAINAADEVDGDVVVLVPEDGRRYLGWW